MRVAIAWYGAEGQSNYRYYVGKGDDVTIVTPRVAPQFPIPDGAQSIVQEDAFDHLDGFELVVRSASIRPDSLTTDGKVWSATNEFFAACPAPIIGVTGTKGKGTTCSLITAILRAAGHTVHLVGNIGTPALDVLPRVKPEDIVVYELSSFQLWDLEKAPNTAVILMVEPDHLDVHKNYEEYLWAKAGIVRHADCQTRILCHPTNPDSARVANEWRDDCQTPADTYGTDANDNAYAKDGMFYVAHEPLCATSALRLPGAHNIENACAAISAAWGFDGVDKIAVETGLASFDGLPHRLKFVREVGGVRYYDDSIATTPGSAIAALRAFDSPKIIILGGSDKGADYQEIVDVCREVGARVIAIGQTGEKIAELCHASGVDVIRETGLMQEVIAVVACEAQAGDVVILSPASASFDQYKSYSDRGDKFAAAVEEL